MSCYHPNKVFQVGYKPNGKQDLLFCSYGVNHVERVRGNWVRCSDDFVSRSADKVVRRFIEIPCGDCIGCRLDYAKGWSDRLMIELQSHKSAYFVTLTYNDAHLPTVAYNSPDSGEIGLRRASLRKRDVQLFLKRLRKNTGQKIRYFCAGEYGSSTLRPHYHLIIFGLELGDLVPYSRNGNGDVLYNSETLQKSWCDREGVPIGFTVIGKVTKESCEYTARYTMKKVGSDSEWFSIRNMEPEFTLMSTHPGIGRDYLDNHPDCFDFDHIMIPTDNGGEKIKIPKYFWRVLDSSDSERVTNHKEKCRKRAMDFNRSKLSNTSQDYLEYLRTEEINRLSRLKGLKKRGDL